MFNLLKVELYKLKKFQFWYLAVLLMFMVGYIYGDNRIGNKVFYVTDTTDVAFSYTVGDTSFVFLIAIVAALFIGKDFSNRTICNEIKLGYSRFQILISRMLVVCVFAVLFHASFVISTVLGFSVVRGFDASVLSVGNALRLLTALVQLIAVLSGVVLISFIAKKMSEAIVISATYAFICCNILRNFYWQNRIFRLTCFYFVDDNSTENLVNAIISAVVTMVIFLTIAAVSFNKADIK